MGNNKKSKKHTLKSRERSIHLPREGGGGGGGSRWLSSISPVDIKECLVCNAFVECLVNEFIVVVLYIIPIRIKYFLVNNRSNGT